MSHRPLIKKGDRVRFKPEWQDPGDDKVEFRAMEDEDGPRIRVEAMTESAFNPNQIVDIDMIDFIVS